MKTFMGCEVTQLFGENLNNSYAADGLKGHTGEDVKCGYGTPIECPIDGYVYKILDDKRPANDGSGFWGVFIITEWHGSPVELLIGHCSKFMCEVGDYVKKGQIIALEGNHGLVFQGDLQITVEMQRAGDQRGTHRHYQTRLLAKTKTPLPNNLTQFAGGLIYTDKDGFVYGIPNYNNGYNGCFDSAPLLAAYAEWKLEQALPKPDPVPVSPEITPAVRSNLQVLLESLKQVLLQLLTRFTRP